MSENQETSGLSHQLFQTLKVLPKQDRNLVETCHYTREKYYNSKELTTSDLQDWLLILRYLVGVGELGEVRKDLIYLLSLVGSYEHFQPFQKEVNFLTGWLKLQDRHFIDARALLQPYLQPNYWCLPDLNDRVNQGKLALLLVQVSVLERNFSKAEQELTDLIKLVQTFTVGDSHPDQPLLTLETVFRQAEVIARQGGQEQVLELLEQMDTNQLSSEELALLTFVKGWISLGKRSSSLVQSQEYLTEALGLVEGPRKGVVMYGLGVMERKSNHFTAARTLFSDALQVGKTFNLSLLQMIALTALVELSFGELLSEDEQSPDLTELDLYLYELTQRSASPPRVDGLVMALRAVALFWGDEAELGEVFLTELTDLSEAQPELALDDLLRFTRLVQEEHSRGELGRPDEVPELKKYVDELVAVVDDLLLWQTIQSVFLPEPLVIQQIGF